MKRKLFILTIILCTVFPLAIANSKSQTVQKVDSNFKTVLIQLQENYDTLTTESCGDAYYLYEDRLKKNNIIYRALSLFADPYQPYETHVTVEVWVNGNWIFIDPTFNGYYLSSETKKPLSAYEIREAVKENRLDEIQWVQNGKSKINYDITKYYINPLYLFRGLMYTYNGETYYITDEWMKPFIQDKSIFNGIGQVIPISSPNEMDSVPSYGVDRGYITTLIKNWNQYKTINTTETGNWVNVKTGSGGIVATVKVEKGKFYAFEVPVIIREGSLTVSVQSATIMIFDDIDKDKNYKSKTFKAQSEELKIYLYSNSSVDFSFDKTNIKLDEMINDFTSKIKIVEDP